MRILIVSDAWLPQINGVVRTYQRLSRELASLGHEVEVLGPDRFKTVPCPTYPEIRLAWNAPWSIAPHLEKGWNAIHIATEGPLGWSARRYCRRRGWPFTTSFHTKFPEYVKARTGIPLSIGYGVMRRFHAPAARTFASTPGLKATLEEKGFAHLVLWSRGVDTALFKPRPKDKLPGAHPIFMYVGRVAIEKNLEAFLSLDLPGSKAVIGDGPQRASLTAAYPAVQFLGAKEGLDLAEHFACGDVFVFPSKTDTFGLVMLEAMACGLPVAAFPVEGPRDVVEPGVTGILDHDLQAAALAALRLSPEACRRHAERYSWSGSANQFLSQLAPLPA